MKNTIAALLLILLAQSARAASVTGKVQFTGRPAGVSVQTIVYAERLDGDARPQAGHFSVAQKNKSFFPRVLAVPVGSTITFPNDDLIFHNVFSLSRPNPFDLGLYRAGDSKERPFTTAAIYKVFCNIHPQMSATILVVPTSYVTEADKNGGYRFDLPAGRYRITAWDERAQPSSVDVAVGTAAQTAPDVTLNESQSADPQHTNKFGQSYPASTYDPQKH